MGAGMGNMRLRMQNADADRADADHRVLGIEEDIRAQWLRRNAQEKRGLTVRKMGIYWSRDGRPELDSMAELDDGGYLFGECKWSANSLVGLSVYSSLRAKIAGLPDAKWRERPTCTLFSFGGFTPELCSLAADPEERLCLGVGGDLL